MRQVCARRSRLRRLLARRKFLQVKRVPFPLAAFPHRSPSAPCLWFAAACATSLNRPADRARAIPKQSSRHSEKIPPHLDAPPKLSRSERIPPLAPQPCAAASRQSIPSPAFHPKPCTSRSARHH